MLLKHTIMCTSVSELLKKETKIQKASGADPEKWFEQC